MLKISGQIGGKYYCVFLRKKSGMVLLLVLQVLALLQVLQQVLQQVLRCRDDI